MYVERKYTLQSLLGWTPSNDKLKGSKKYKMKIRKKD